MSCDNIKAGMQIHRNLPQPFSLMRGEVAKEISNFHSRQSVKLEVNNTPRLWKVLL